MTTTVLNLLALAALAHAAPANPENALTLDQATQEAKSHNPYYLRAEAAAHEAGWRQLEALSGNLPKLSASAFHYFSEKYQYITVTNFGPTPIKFPGIYPTTQVSLDASWTVFDGLQTPLAFAAARLSKQAADLELERTELQVEEDVRLKFYQALGAQLLASVAEQDLKTLREHLAKSRELLDRGKATRFDTLRVQVQLDEAEPEKLAADDNVVLTRRALSQAIGVEDDTRPLVGMLPIPLEPKNIAELKLEPAQRADLAALDARTRAAENSYLSSLGTWIPRVSFAASKQWYDNVDSSLAFSNPASYSDAYNVGIFLTWNIFDGGASLARQRAASYQHQQAEASLRAAQLKAPNDLETWRRRLLSNISLYRARMRAIEAAEESVRLARLSYAAGTRTSTDVLDAELDLFRARAGQVRAQIDASEALANLELALGHKL